MNGSLNEHNSDGKQEAGKVAKRQTSTKLCCPSYLWRMARVEKSDAMRSSANEASRVACPLALAIIFGTSLVFGMPPVAKAAELPRQVSLLVDQVKAEGGKVNVFGKPLNPQQNAEMSRRISAFYGAPIEVRLFSSLHAGKAGETIQNVKLGVNSGIDVFWTGAAIADLLRKNQVVTTIDWVKDVGLDPSLRMSDDGVRVDDETLASVMYNTNLVKPGEEPKTYQELGANEAWKRKIALPRTAATFVHISYGIGFEASKTLAQKLIGQQQAVVLPTFPDVRARVLGGEFAIGIATDGILARRSGAPAGLADIAPMIVVPTGAWLLKDTQHPASGKLFVYWLTTPDGQKALYDVLGISLVTTPGTELNAMAKGKTAMVVPYEYTVEGMRTQSQAFNQILGIR